MRGGRRLQGIGNGVLAWLGGLLGCAIFLVAMLGVDVSWPWEESGTEGPSARETTESEWWERADDLVGESHAYREDLAEAHEKWVLFGGESCKDAVCQHTTTGWPQMLAVEAEWNVFLDKRVWDRMLDSAPGNRAFEALLAYYHAADQYYLFTLAMEDKDTAFVSNVEAEYEEARNNWIRQVDRFVDDR